MPTTDTLAHLKPQPATFAVGGTGVYLRPLTGGDRAALLAWHQEAKDKPGTGDTLAFRLVSLGVSDAAGVRLLPTDEAAAELDAQVIDLIAREVTRRNGLGGTPDPKASTAADSTSSAG